MRLQGGETRTETENNPHGAGLLSVSDVSMGKPGQTSLEFPSRDASPSAEWLLTETDGQAAPELARCDTVLPALADVSSCACAGVGTRAEEGSSALRQMCTCP